MLIVPTCFATALLAPVGALVTNTYLRWEFAQEMYPRSCSQPKQAGAVS